MGPVDLGVRAHREMVLRDDGMGMTMTKREDLQMRVQTVEFQGEVRDYYRPATDADLAALGYVHVSQMVDMFDKAVYPTMFDEDLDGWFVPRQVLAGFSQETS